MSRYVNIDVGRNKSACEEWKELTGKSLSSVFQKAMKRLCRQEGIKWEK